MDNSGTYIKTVLSLILFVSMSFKHNNKSTVEEKDSQCQILQGASDIPNSFKDSLHQDSIYVTQNKDLSTEHVKYFDVYNTTQQTVYLYSGLMQSDWIKQPFVHQIDTARNSYVFSLTPLYRNFRNQFQHTTPIEAHYNWYTFTQIGMNQRYRIRVYIGNNYLAEKHNAICLIPAKEIQSALQSTMVSLRDYQVKNASIRLGVYKDIANLCNNNIVRADSILYEQKRFDVIQADFAYWGYK